MLNNANKLFSESNNTQQSNKPKTPIHTQLEAIEPFAIVGGYGGDDFYIGAFPCGGSERFYNRLRLMYDDASITKNKKEWQIGADAFPETVKALGHLERFAIEHDPSTYVTDETAHEKRFGQLKKEGIELHKLKFYEGAYIVRHIVNLRLICFGQTGKLGMPPSISPFLDGNHNELIGKELSFLEFAKQYFATARMHHLFTHDMPAIDKAEKTDRRNQKNK